MNEFKRALKALLLTLLAYLIQACVMKHLQITGVSGSVVFAVIAVLTVSYGKKYTFCASCIIGLLMESMLSNVPAFYVIAYPVVSMVWAQVFADKNDRQRERKRMYSEAKRHRREGKKPLHLPLGKVRRYLKRRGMPAHLRIPLCAVMMDLLMNGIYLVYMYLIGVEFSWAHIVRPLVSILYTGGIAALWMVPLRAFLGMYKGRKEKQKGGELW